MRADGLIWRLLDVDRELGLQHIDARSLNTRALSPLRRGARRWSRAIWIGEMTMGSRKKGYPSARSPPRSARRFALRRASRARMIEQQQLHPAPPARLIFSTDQRE
jgi:hypothetical protein